MIFLFSVFEELEKLWNCFYTVSVKMAFKICVNYIVRILGLRHIAVFDHEQKHVP